jgi:RimJ/RimL family protein N-acetyltransferase
VDEAVLTQLVLAATTDAVADEVTPPVTAGHEWTSARVAWLRDFHRARRDGLAGSAGEATWAVVVEGVVVGSVRLKSTEEDGVLEAGIWVTRGARGRGTGRAAMAAVLRQAATLEATAVRADTTVANAGALAVLSRLGFNLTPDEEGHDVRAQILLGTDVVR